MATQPEEFLTFTDIYAQNYLLAPNDILYVEADNIYSRIVCENLIIRVPHPLILMETLLPDYFLRIHRSFLVNQNSIVALYRRIVMLHNGFRLPVPHGKYQWLKECLEATETNTLP